MPTTNESREVKDDKEIEILFPEIEKNKNRILLNYMASTSIHSDGLKKHILDFLTDKEKKKEISDIEAFSNTSIYFRLPQLTPKARLKKLHNDFKAHLAPFEKEHKGKVFWIFNAIANFDNVNLDESAMIGTGDETYHTHFAKKISH